MSINSTIVIYRLADDVAVQRQKPEVFSMIVSPSMNYQRVLGDAVFSRFLLY